MELHRDNLLSDLKRLAGETIDRVERMKGIEKEFDPDQHLGAAKREAKKVLNPNADFETPVRKPSMPMPPHLTEQPVFADNRQPQKSFFDDIQ